MEPSADEVAETLRLLGKTAPFFRRVASGLSEDQLRRPPGPGAWSVLEVLAHLRGCADVQGAWIAKMLAEDEPRIRYRSARTGMRKTGYEERDFASFLRDFAAQRRALVSTLTDLHLTDWGRVAAFTGTTPGWSPTVHDLCRGMAGHEHAHFRQAEDAAGAT